MDFLTFVSEVGFPIAGAIAAGFFVFTTLKFILASVTGSVCGLQNMISALDNRVQTMNNDLVKIDALMSYALNVKESKQINFLETKWKNENLPAISWHSLLNDMNKNNKINIRQFDQEHHVIQAALAGQGIALVSSLLVENALKQGWLQDYKLADVSQHITGYSYYLLIPEHNIRSKSMLAFRQWLLDEMRL